MASEVMAGAASRRSSRAAARDEREGNYGERGRCAQDDPQSPMSPCRRRSRVRRGREGNGLGGLGGHGGRAGRGTGAHDGGDETVAHAGDGLDKAWMFRPVAEEIADFADRGVDAVFGVDKDFARPKALGNFSARDEFPLALDQEDEQLHRFSFEGEAAVVKKKFEATAVEPKTTEFVDGTGHGSPLRGRSIALLNG
jgi:hypothetical protein